jgi:predicted TIM-barrel fold metal-dependent hydrolase
MSGTRPYALISADSHVNEPPDLWTSRVASQYADRAPRIEHFEKGDAWVLEGAREPVPFGRNACAGMAPWPPDPWMRFEEVRPGGYDPRARLLDQDLDGVDAEVLFPTPRVSNAVFVNADRDFHVACVRAYNDWIAEFCAYAPDRFAGIALLPNSGLDDAIAEGKRVAELPGINAVTIGMYPHGDVHLEPEDDRLWATLEELDLTLTIHVRLTETAPGAHHATLREGVIRMLDVPVRLEEFIYTGVMWRFPRLRVAFVEVDAGWVPYWKEQAYNRWRRQDPALRADRGMAESPLSCMDRIGFTYITDRHAVHNRHLVGVDQLMWSSDYPHSASDFPFSWRTIESDFYGVPDLERQAILADNAVRFFKLPVEGRGV